MRLYFQFLASLCVLGVCSKEWIQNNSVSLLLSMQKDSTNIQQTMECSESWCNGSLTCSEIYRDSCPPGLICKDGLCECPNQYPHIMKCDNASLLVPYGYCATFNETTKALLIGHCIYTANPLYASKDMNKVSKFHELCISYGRTGALCGRCLPGHYPLAYSYNMTCIPCPHARWNWFRYIMAAYLPLTLFYIVILFFNTNITSSHLFAVIYLCQFLSLPLVLQKIFISVAKLTNSYNRTLKVFASLYAFWNLDFFRPFYTDLCLGIGILPTLALDYVIAVYPLFLMIITYILIVLYDRNYRVIIAMSRPFRLLFSLLQRNYDIKTALIDTSAFFFFTNTRFLSTSFSLLSQEIVYHLHGDNYNYTLGLYYAADIEYFGSEHLPYAIFAIAMLCVFVILPITVLALYQFSFFQKFLNLFPVRWYTLHTFMDSFQSCYKNGTEPGTRDCRWLVSVYFIIRIVLLFTFSLTEFSVYMVVFLITTTIHTSLLVIVQPYKHTMAHLNKINIIPFQLVFVCVVCVLGCSFSTVLSPYLTEVFFILSNILAVCPQVYLVVLLLYWMYTHRLNMILLRLNAWRRGYVDLSNDLPDRIENPGAYHRDNLTDFAHIPPPTPLPHVVAVPDK